MSLFETLTKRTGRVANDVQQSLRRARLEGERRLLQRQHRTALEELGAKAFELVRAGQLPEDGMSPEVAAVEGKLMEIDAKVSEIDALKTDDEAAADGGADAASTAFPMVGDGDRGAPHAGPGWSAADRFFRGDK
jgi:hypothetical protein